MLKTWKRYLRDWDRDRVRVGLRVRVRVRVRVRLLKTQKRYIFRKQESSLEPNVWWCSTLLASVGVRMKMKILPRMISTVNPTCESKRPRPHR